jgi:hypothetical protein
MKTGVEDYLRGMNVTILKLNFTQCDKSIMQHDTVNNQKKPKQKEGNTCIHPYSDIQMFWGRYPFLRDALQTCTQCTGPVLVCDAQDTLFQRDPFGDGIPKVHGMQSLHSTNKGFEEHRDRMHSLSKTNTEQLRGRPERNPGSCFGLKF